MKPNFLSEGVRLGAKSKLTRMGVYLAYIPIRGNELGAENDPLSQEIYIIAVISHTNAREPCCCVVESISRKASMSTGIFSSSTIASIEVFIEGHAWVP